MKVSYDHGADVLEVELSDAPAARTEVQEGRVVVQFDRVGRVLSVQVLEASRQFDARYLSQLRSPVIHLNLAEAAKESGLAAATLRVLLNSGRLKGKKRGRDWFVTAADLDTYLESRAPSGRPAVSAKARRALRFRKVATVKRPTPSRKMRSRAVTGAKGARKK